MDSRQFKKEDRLLKRSEFLQLASIGTKIQNRHFVLIYADNEKKVSRIGITVTKRVANAVVRNRIKRCCREFFRQKRCIIPGRKDVNLIAKKNALALDSKQMFQTLENIFKKINWHEFFKQAAKVCFSCVDQFISDDDLTYNRFQLQILPKLL